MNSFSFIPSPVHLDNLRRLGTYRTDFSVIFPERAILICWLRLIDKKRKNGGKFRETHIVINCKFTHQQIFNQNPYFLEFVKVQLSSLVILVIVKDYYSAQPDQFTLITITVVIDIPHDFGQFYSPFIYYIMPQFPQRPNHCHHYHDHHPIILTHW